MDSHTTCTADDVPAESGSPSVRLSYPSMLPTPPDYGTRDFKPARPEVATKSSPPPGPTAPLPKRPRGRSFIGVLMLSFLAALAYCLYESFVRYAAYGEVVGRKIQLAPPWDGVVSALHVRVGDVVRQGDVIFHVESIAMRHRMEQIEDSLNLERARLGSELARVKWEAQRVKDTEQLVKADWYEKWSELLWEQSVLTDLAQQLSRARQLRSEGAVAAEALDSLECRVTGQERRITQLQEAVESLRRRAELDRPVNPSMNDQIKPALVRIENLQGELRRVRQLLDQRTVTSPANGLVTRITKFSGEFAGDADPVVEVLVDGSTEIVLYLPQSRSKDWVQGDLLNVHIEPDRAELRCVVAYVAPEMRMAPPLIMRHYAADEVLMPVVARPVDTAQLKQLVVGSKVRLPRRSSLSQLGQWLGWTHRASNVASQEAEAGHDSLSATSNPPAQDPSSYALLK